MIRQLRLVTRKSALALWQARHVAGLLEARHPGVRVAVVEMSTEGDRFLSAPLAQVGGKGLFVKELELALLEGRADLAVHSLKDMTSEQPEGLTLASVPEREDPRDAWVSPQGVAFASLGPSSQVGTSSLRRTSQLCAHFPGVSVVSLRGNVQTRLDKTREQHLSGTVLALAGLKRLGLEGQVTQVLEPEQFLPAAGQGALALQCRAADAQTLEMLAGLEHAPTRTAVSAERACLAKLEGGCTIPLAAYATFEEGGATLRVRGLVGAPDGKKVVRAEVKGPPASARSLGEALAQALLDGGAGDILMALKMALKVKP